MAMGQQRPAMLRGVGPLMDTGPRWRRGGRTTFEVDPTNFDVATSLRVALSQELMVVGTRGRRYRRPLVSSWEPIRIHKVTACNFYGHSPYSSHFYGATGTAIVAIMDIHHIFVGK